MTDVSLIDRWTESLRSDTRSKAASAEKLIVELQKNYRDEVILAKKMEAESQHLQYEHLRAEAMKLAEEKRRYAERLEKLIERLGGKPDKSGLADIQVEAAGQFTEILRIETEMGERLIDQLNFAEDAGLEESAHELIRMKEDHYNHQEKIERLIMKINAAL